MDGAKSGLIHDSVHLDVVYEVVRFPDGCQLDRTRERVVKKAKERYPQAVPEPRRSGKRTGLTASTSARARGYGPTA